MSSFKQFSFSAGELAPSLWARADTSKYQSGLKTCRNYMVMRHGGVTNRPGFRFIAEVKDSTKTVRLVPFIFNSDQTYELEFGDQYIRFFKDAAPVYKGSKQKGITGITKATQAVVTSASHGYSNGDEISILGVAGMTEVNGRNFKISDVTTNTYKLRLMDGTTYLNSTSFGAYTSGGSSYFVYELSSTYLEAELPLLKFVQSADVITLVHPNHAPAKLSRIADDNWTLTDITFAPQVSAPATPTLSDVTISSYPTSGTDVSWVVTAVSNETQEESFASTSSGLSTNYTTDSDAIATAQAHIGAGNLTLDGSDGSGPYSGVGRIITAYSASDLSGLKLKITGTDGYGNFQEEEIIGPNNGTVSTVQYFWTVASVYTNTDINVATVEIGLGQGACFPQRVDIGVATTGYTYNFYRQDKSVANAYGFVGTSTIGSGAFVDTGLKPDITIQPPITRNPFQSSNNPATVAYFQQRQFFGNTIASSEKIEASRPGQFFNFTTSLPIQDDDAVSFSIFGRRVNSVKHLVDIGNLCVLTSDGEWVVQGDAAGIIRPGQINPKQHSYNGSSDIAPIVIGGTLLYVQARSSIIRDLNFTFQVDGYRGNDLTIFSAHLFDGHTIVDWSYQQTPHSIIWAVRDDGKLIGLTYVEEQQILGWHQHDTDGTVENVSVIPEGNEDALYLVVKRTIGGVTKRYVERMENRYFSDVKDAIFMDSNLSYDGRQAALGFETRTMTLSGGTTWDHTETLTLSFDTSAGGFFTLANEVGNGVELVGSDGTILRFTITGVTSAYVVTGNVSKTVPVSMRGIAITDFTKQLASVSGLWHLEGKDVSVIADGYVVGSPNNSSYAVYTVSNGSISFPRPYGVIHVGLPYIADIQTLEIDTPQSAGTIAGKKKLVTRLTAFLESTRGLFAGTTEPTDLLDGLYELKVRDLENYDSPVDLKTGKADVIINDSWNDNGSVFIRQVDPLPSSILAVVPDGLFPFGGG